MKNSDIKYKLSTDYKRLNELLKSGIIIIGITPLSIGGEFHDEYSKLVELRYDSEHKIYHLGYTFFEKDLNKISFEELCEKDKIKFIDI